ncbi:MAG TPA: hypothetical protein PKM50_05695 [Methanoregula sp.]|nr:hypothetical protein [Methanoregula sp.]
MLNHGRLPEYTAAAVIIIIVGSLLFGAHASAALVIANETFLPEPPLHVNSGQHTEITIAVIPSGAATFARTHSIQMQTDLTEARWNIQVFVNGIPAAEQSASGTAAFINGYLLSYPTTSDVSFTITLDGTVPEGSKTNVTILRITELDTSGMSVPGSSLVVISPVITSTPTDVTIPLDTTFVSMSETTHTSTQAGAHPYTGLMAIIIVITGSVYTRLLR